MGRFFGLLATASIGALVTVFADGHPARFHKDRARGVGHLTIEVDGADADISFSAVSADIYGFSSAPSPEDHAKVEVLNKITQGVRSFGKELIEFPENLNCQLRVHILGEFVGDHGSRQTDDIFSENEPIDPVYVADLRAALQVPKNDFLLRMAVHCAKEIKGSEIKFSLSAHFPQVQRIKVYIFEGLNIKAGEIENDLGGMTP